MYSHTVIRSGQSVSIVEGGKFWRLVFPDGSKSRIFSDRDGAGFLIDEAYRNGKIDLKHVVLFDEILKHSEVPTMEAIFRTLVFYMWVAKTSPSQGVR